VRSAVAEPDVEIDLAFLLRDFADGEADRRGVEAADHRTPSSYHLRATARQCRAVLMSADSTSIGRPAPCAISSTRAAWPRAGPGQWRRRHRQPPDRHLERLRCLRPCLDGCEAHDTGGRQSDCSRKMPPKRAMLVTLIRVSSNVRLCRYAPT